MAGQELSTTELVERYTHEMHVLSVAEELVQIAVDDEQRTFAWECVREAKNNIRIIKQLLSQKVLA